MTYNDLVGTIGVGIILLAYFLATEKLISASGKTYYVMNIFGAGLACYASYLIAYWPFVILEGSWVLVSLYGLMKSMKIKMT